MERKRKQRNTSSGQAVGRHHPRELLKEQKKGRVASRILPAASVARPVSWLVAGWVATIPAALCLYYVATRLAPAVAPAKLTTAAGLFVPEARRELAPEPVEQTAYVLAISIVPAVLLASALGIRGLGSRLQRRPGVVIALQSIAGLAQIGLVVFAVRMWVTQISSVYAYFTPFFLAWTLSLAGIVIILSAASVAAGWTRTMRSSVGAFLAREPRILRATALCGAIVLTAIALLPSVLTSNSVEMGPYTVVVHLPYTLGEFAAVLNGRSPLGDFYPQYSLLLPYLMLPVFSATGISTTTFSLAMTILSGAGLLCCYWTFKIVTGNPWSALLLYAGLVGMAVYSALERHDLPANLFNYYAIAPIRFVLPAFVMVLTAASVVAPERRKTVVLFLVAALAAVNNLDFGVSALVGCAAAVVLARSADSRSVLRHAAQIGLLSVAALGVVIGAFSFTTLLRSGRLPQAALVLSYQQIFTRYGFYLIAMPATGIHLLIYATFMAALVTGVILLLTRSWATSPASPAMMVYGAIFGCGVGAYYVGRSHPHSLVVVFWPWAFCLLLLCWESFQQLRLALHTRQRTQVALLCVPAVLLFAHCAIGYADLTHLRSPVRQWRRMQASAGLWRGVEDTITSEIRRRTQPSEKVGIVFPYGHLFAIRAGVENIFPFSHPGSLILLSQMDLAVNVFLDDRVTTLFGSFTPTFQAKLQSHGFQKIAAFPVKYPSFPTQFETWTRAAPP
jgi:hypothetical protein